MSTLTLVLLGIRLAFALLQNASTLGEDVKDIHLIAAKLISGQHPTDDEWKQVETLTAKLLSAELSAAMKPGVLPAKAP
jgi:hypothetical protein